MLKSKDNFKRNSKVFRREFRNKDSRAEGSLLGNSVITSHLRKLGYSEKSIESMIRCGTESGFKIVKNCGCGPKVIAVTYHCSNRVCPNCSKIRKRRVFKKYSSLFENFFQNRKYFFYFLTISPKNYKNLEYGLKHIKESFSKFLRHNYIKERIKGGLYVIETKGEEGNWNIHIHAIIYGRWIDNKIRKEKDSKIVRLFRQSSQREVNIDIRKRNSVRGILNYMLKYISANKDEFSTDLDIAKYIVAINGKRLIHAFGEFYNIKFKKTSQTCNKCNREIEYIIDIEVVQILEEAINKPPDPNFLSTYI